MHSAHKVSHSSFTTIFLIPICSHLSQSPSHLHLSIHLLTYYYVPNLLSATLSSCLVCLCCRCYIIIDNSLASLSSSHPYTTYSACRSRSLLLEISLILVSMFLFSFSLSHFSSIHRVFPVALALGCMPLLLYLSLSTPSTFSSLLIPCNPIPWFTFHASFFSSSSFSFLLPSRLPLFTEHRFSPTPSFLLFCCSDFHRHHYHHHHHRRRASSHSQIHRFL